MNRKMSAGLFLLVLLMLAGCAQSPTAVKDSAVDDIPKDVPAYGMEGVWEQLENQDSSVLNTLDAPLLLSMIDLFPDKEELNELAGGVYCTSNNGGVTYAPGEGQEWVKVTFGALPVNESLERPVLNLAVVLDASGSMNGTSWELLDYLLEQLNQEIKPEDRVAVIIAGQNIQVTKNFSADTAPVDFTYLIDSIQPDGRNDLEVALATAFSVFNTNTSDHSSTENRVLLITDDFFTNKDHVPATLDQLIRSQASANRMFSLVSLERYWPEWADELFQSTRGANATCVKDRQQVYQWVHQGFETMMFPVAYDLELRFSRSDTHALDGLIPVDGGIKTGATIRWPTLHRTDTALSVLAKVRYDDDIGADSYVLVRYEIDYLPRDGDRISLASADVSRQDGYYVSAGTSTLIFVSETSDTYRAILLTEIVQVLGDIGSYLYQNQSQESSGNVPDQLIEELNALKECANGTYGFNPLGHPVGLPWWQVPADMHPVPLILDQIEATFAH